MVGNLLRLDFIVMAVCADLTPLSPPRSRVEDRCGGHNVPSLEVATATGQDPGLQDCPHSLLQQLGFIFEVAFS